MVHRQNTFSPRWHTAPIVVLVLLAWLGTCLPAVADSATPRAAGPVLPEGVTLSTARYPVPALKLRDATGQAVELPRLFSEPGPLVVNFIFTSCPEICPVMTGTQIQLQRRLRGTKNAPRFVSITLDPEQDTPTVLAEYAARFGADWVFLTGSRSEVLQTLQAFDAWRGNKMNHAAVTLMRAGPGDPWTRIEGLAPVGTLAEIWRSVAPP